MTDTYDAVVIGTGQAGPGLASRATQEGWRVAVVERHLVGGTCVNAGCTPTKALVGSARAIHMTRRGKEFGFDIGTEPAVDMARVKERMKSIAQTSNDGLNTMFDQNDSIELVRGHAKIDGPGRVVVGDRVLETDRIFVNVGARPRMLDLPGVEDIDVLTSSTILELDEVPDHLIIVGGSHVGLEFAQIHRRLGARVTVIERGPRLISRDDPDVNRQADDRSDGLVGVDIDCTDGPSSIVGSHLLLAVGRIPNTDDLGLDTVGVATDDHGYITVDDHLRTGVVGIWALGDCNGEGAFTHTSYNDNEIVVANLFDADTDEFLGGAIFGLHGDEVIHLIADAMYAKAPYTTISRAVHIHPTVAELVPTTLQDLEPLD